MQIIATLFLFLLAGIFLYNIIHDKENNQYTDAEEGLKVGMKAPDWELSTLDGESVRLSDLQGKKVFINFWATWCGPCREEMPAMESFYQEYQGEVEILAVNAFNTEVDGRNKVSEFIEDYKLSFPVLLDKDGKVVNDYQVTHMPTTIFIGTDGVIQEPPHRGPMDEKYMNKIRKKLN